MPAFRVGLPEQFGAQHCEVISDDQADLGFGPVISRCGVLIALDGFPLVDHGEPQFSQDVIRLARCLTAAEVFGQQRLASKMGEREPDDGLGRIPLALVEQFVLGGIAKIVLGAGVEVSQRTKDVVACQPRRNGLRHGIRLP